eukprot:5678666-Pyramimonas_sp.AAC.1
MTLSRDIAAISSRACPASPIMSRATGEASLRDSAASCVAMIILASLSNCARKVVSSLEGPLRWGWRLCVL